MAGGYRRLDWRHAPVIVIAAVGAVVPTALAAAKYLSEEGVLPS
jgi:transketolase C-terminal domain/subunit